MRYVFLMVVMDLLLAVGFAMFSFHSYRTPSVPEATTVVIERGMGAKATLRQLHAQGLLPAPWKIALPILLSGEQRNFKAGEYALVAGMAPQQVIGAIVRGDVVVHAVTLPEGWSVAQLRTILRNEPLLTGDVPAVIEEGSVAPDTIHFQRGDSRASVVERLQLQQKQRLKEAWDRRVQGLPLKTARDALILASIIEAETGVEEERRRVAAVYINRLARGMALQADPTVAYGIAPGGMTRPLTRNDLKRPTPYNTYIHVGLPPGPINNPGNASIEAAVHPLQTNELYFVATGNGGHWFAATLAEHERNVAKYRAVQRAKP